MLDAAFVLERTTTHHADEVDTLRRGINHLIVGLIDRLRRDMVGAVIVAREEIDKCLEFDFTRHFYLLGHTHLLG